MGRQLASMILALAVLAAVSCSDDARELTSDAASKPRDLDAGDQPPHSGSRALDAGSAPGFPKADGPCDAGPLLSGVKYCAPPRFDRQGICKIRHEGVQCYLPPTGSACAPPNDRLLETISDSIASAGFAAEFVLDEAPAAEVPASCDPLLDCCARVTDASRRMGCYDQLDDPEKLQYCGVRTPRELQQEFGCSAPGQVGAGMDAGGADEDAGARPILCCYRVCGFDSDA